MPDPSSFTTSLLGAFLQFGAFGALVAWVVMAIMPRIQKEAVAARAEFRESLRQVTGDFRDEMRLERESHRQEHTELRAEIHDGFERIEGVVGDVGLRNGRGKSS